MKNIEKLLQIERVSPLKLGDEDLFRQFVDSYRPRDKCNFEDSWAYILQSCRNYPLKYLLPEELILFTIKDNNSGLVIPNYFASSHRSLADIVRKVSQETNLPVILKNVNPENIPSFKKLGFDQYGSGEEWSPQHPYDDQTFPQRIVDLVSLVNRRGNKYRTLKWELNKSPKVKVKPYVKERDYSEAKRLLDRQDSRLNGLAYNSHIMFLDLEPDDNILSAVFLIEDKIVGFTLLDKISDDCVAYNGLIYDASIPFLSTRITYETGRLALESGYKFMNFQGSETQNIDNWKKKFCPTKSIEKTHMIYRVDN